jgi:hypothetical protein
LPFGMKAYLLNFFPTLSFITKYELSGLRQDYGRLFKKSIMASLTFSPFSNGDK